MKMIAKMAKQIREELHDADKYISLAIKDKEKDKELADMYFTLANEEIGHADKIHTQVVREIKKVADNQVRMNPEEVEQMKSTMEVMYAVWDYEHENLMEEAAEIRTKIEMYNKR